MASILMLTGEFTEEYEIYVFQKGMEAIGHVVHVVCPDKNAGDMIRTSLHDFEGHQTYLERYGHLAEINKTFAEVDPAEYDAVYCAGGRGPEYIRIDSPEAGGEIHVGHGVTCTLNQKLWYAVRPEKLRLTRDRPQARNAFPVYVEDVAYMGNSSVFRLKLDTGKYMHAAKPNLTRYDEDAITWHENVWVSWDDTAGVVLTL